jgi:hypothetical protein
MSVTDRGGTWCCEASMLPHFPENRLTDGGELVSFTSRQAALTRRKIPGTHFY